MEGNEVVSLYLDDIIPNRFQPREVFDEGALRELAASIKEHGVIQPIIVRKIGDKYEIIAGERRYKASVLAGLTKIPAIIRNLDDKECSKVALLENLQRRDLTSIEEARTYQKIIELDQMTQFELAKTMGKSQSAIANKLRLLSLPLEVQDALLNNQISERHARSLLNLSNPDEQIQMMNRIIENRMTVRELDDELKQKLEVNKPIEPVVEEVRNFIEKPTISNESIFNDNITDIPRGIPEIDLRNTNNNVVSEEPINQATDITDFNSVNNNIDLDKLRQQSINIIPPEKPMADMDSLLKVETPDSDDDETPAQQNYKFIPTFADADADSSEPIEPEKEDNMNFNDIVNSFNNVTPEVIKEVTIESPTPVPIPNKIEEIELLDDEPVSNNEFGNQASINEVISNKVQEIETPIFDLKSAINSTRNNIKNIERAGFVVDTEEIDFEDTYQIIIKIDKNK